MATMPTMINQPLPAVQADAALYFMPDGHYLFVCQADGSQQSKFVTSNASAQPLPILSKTLAGWATESCARVVVRVAIGLCTSTRPACCGWR